ncbi:MAG: hypothetical protein ACNA8L_12935 [Luteolibacter sp.]
MNESLTNFRKRCLDAALDLLWRQWCSLGVAGHSCPAEPGTIIDPEALLLATTCIGKHDPRLFDECLDWLSQHASRLHLQRLKTLHADTGLGDPVILAAIADWLFSQGGQAKWKDFTKTDAHHVEPVPLFDHAIPPDPDPVFAKRGVLRPPIRVRGMSRLPNPTLPPNLLLSLRALIGTSARAEVILCLATGPAAHPSEIARLTGYKARTMQLLLQEMALSGHVLTGETALRPAGKQGRGSSRRYHLKAADWQFLTAGTPLPRWISWPPLWSLIQTLLDVLPKPGDAEKHPALLSSALRDRLAADGEALAAAGLLPLLDLRAGATGQELLASLETTVPGLLDSL